MTKLLERAGASFLRAFAVVLLFAATGIINAPDQQTAVALSFAALAAALAAGLRAVQVFVPQISFASFLKQPYAAWLDSFTRAFVGVFITVWLGWLAAPDWSAWRAVLLAAVIGAVTAGVRALQGFLTKGEDPAPQTGLA